MQALARKEKSGGGGVTLGMGAAVAAAERARGAEKVQKVPSGCGVMGVQRAFNRASPAIPR